MQRRSFLTHAACVGACATALVPLSRAFADEVEARDETIAMRLTRVGDAASSAAGVARVRVTANALVGDVRSLRVRAWFATDIGPQAFDLASFHRGDASQRLRFNVDPQRLIGFEAATGTGFDDCMSAAACGLQGMAEPSLHPGLYQLWLHRGDVAIAAIELDVSSTAA